MQFKMDVISNVLRKFSSNFRLVKCVKIKKECINNNQCLFRKAQLF